MISFLFLLEDKLCLAQWFHQEMIINDTDFTGLSIDTEEQLRLHMWIVSDLAP